MIFELFQVYKINVSSLSSVSKSWFVHRRYSDFFKLRNMLMKENPKLACQLSFPPKRWIGSNLEPTFLGRRFAGLQVFLAAILERKELKSSPDLLSFLCLYKAPEDGLGKEANRV